MEDYKNQQWWKELSEELSSFDDSKMSDSKLREINGSIISGNIAKSTGRLQSICSMGGQVGGKTQGNNNVNNGHLDKIRKIANDKLKVSVLQFDRHGVYIKEWESINLASKTLKIHKGCIINVCKGTQKTGGGFIWKYKE